jgi:hypothetical protein
MMPSPRNNPRASSLAVAYDGEKKDGKAGAGFGCQQRRNPHLPSSATWDLDFDKKRRQDKTSAVWWCKTVATVSGVQLWR